MQVNSKYLDVKGINTHYHEEGDGAPVVLIHGSGPGVTAWANWRLVFPKLANAFKLYAPDVVGFGYTDRPEGITYDVDTKVNHMISFIESVHQDPVSLVGNSMGGALSLHIAKRRPDLIEKVVLMGSAGISFPITKGLEKVWGYEPSVENMRELLDIFAYDRSLVNDELAQMRYEASIQPGFQESFSQMFPAPRQRHVERLALSEEEIQSIQVPTLLIHGREDKVVPFQTTSLRIFELLPNAQLHVFSQCGHWTQIEKTDDFCNLVKNFFNK